MKKIIFCMVLLLIPLFLFSQQINVQTVAEKTNYKETSRYNDVMRFVKALKKGSGLVEFRYIGTSTEGFKIPLMIIGKPEFRNPVSARANNKLVIYYQANIHAGEVEGKEAVLMLTRDLINTEEDVFNDIVLLVTPIYNIDGNEKISPQNRRNQVGPEGGVGVRYNGQNLDLNREGIKVEAPETKALFKEIFNKWDPHIFVDCHTTNGSKHQYSLTFSAPINPNTPAELFEYSSNNLLNEVIKEVKKKYNHDFFYYGNLRRNRESGEYEWRTTPVQARFITNYYGFRNRIGILSEAYAYKDFKTRVDATYRLLYEIIKLGIRDKEKIYTLLNKTDMEQAASDEPIGLTFEPILLPEKATILTYKVKEENRRSYRPMPDDEPISMEVNHYGAYKNVKTVTKPAYYIFPKNIKNLAKLLRLHNIKIGTLIEDIEAESEIYFVTKLEKGGSLYQGHYLQTVEVDKATETRKFQKGDFIVPMDQPVYKLIAYILEPESEDGIVAWGLINKFLQVKRERGWYASTGEYPVYRVMNKKEYCWRLIE